MSFNLRLRTIFDGPNHWNFRRDLLLSTIRAFDPDLLGTQECLEGQARWLRDNLSDYHFIGAGRNDGQRNGEMCGVYFKSDKFELLDSGHFWLSNEPGEPGSRSWGSAFPRMATWAKLRKRQTGQVLCFFNTHFDHSASRARLQSAHLIRSKIDQIADGLPTIITGDFNTDEGSDPYEVMIGQGTSMPLIDTFRSVNPQRTRYEGTRHGFRGGTRGERIDWILTCKAFDTVSAQIDRSRNRSRYPSDHFPVSAVLRPVTRPHMAQVE